MERLAWRAAGNAAAVNPFDEDGGQDDGDTFDAHQLNDAFIQSIKDLTVMLEKQHKKCQSLEQVSLPIDFHPTRCNQTRFGGNL